MWLGFGLLVFAKVLFCTAQTTAGEVVKYNLTLSSASPILTYSEPSNVTAEQGWNQSYTNSSWTNYHYMRLAEGNSTFTTRLPGARVSVNFVGTGVYFQGAGNGKVTLAVDNDEREIALEGGDGVVGERQLEYGNHTARLTLVEGEISLTHVLLSTVVGGAGVTPIPDAITSLDEADFTNPKLSLTGRWQENNQVCSKVPDDTTVNCLRYDCLSTNIPDATIKMNVPANASTALLYGLVGSMHSPFSVTLNPAPPHGPSTQAYTASRTWQAANTELYMASLNPTVQYTLTIMNLGTEEVIEWAKATFLVAQGGEVWDPRSDAASGAAGGDSREHDSTTEQPSGDSSNGTGASKSSFPTGAVAGGVVGGVAVFAGIGAIIWALMRRRRRAQQSLRGEKYSLGRAGGRRHKTRNSKFEVDRLEDDYGRQLNRMSDYHVLSPQDQPKVTPLPMPTAGEGHELSTTMSPLKTALTSPTSPSSQGPWQSGWTMHNGHGSKHQEAFPLSPATDAPPGGATTWHATTMPPNGALAPGVHSSTVVTEAEDAGRLETQPNIVEEQVPPRYNPAWAEDDAKPASTELRPSI